MCGVTTPVRLQRQVLCISCREELDRQKKREYYHKKKAAMAQG